MSAKKGEEEEEGERGGDRVEGGEASSPVTAALLIVPGIVLYVFILYTMIFKIVHPASFSPFTAASHQPPPSEDSKQYSIGLSHPLIWDGILLVVFALQHSVMACDGLKGLFKDIGVAFLSRPLYVCSTCFVIYVIHEFWLPYRSEAVWSLDSSGLRWVLVLVHLLSWASIACSMFTIDYLELVGIKQVYYSFYGFESPMTYKSEEQQLLFGHNRHPIFLAPMLILWAVPVMSYGRLLICVMMPLYMILTSNIDTLDRSYVLDQYSAKMDQLLKKNGLKRS